jgi:HSP20 family molecular chaperone IbpA
LVQELQILLKNNSQPKENNMKINDKYEISPFGNTFDSLFSLLSRGETCDPFSQTSSNSFGCADQKVRYKYEGDQLRVEFLVPGWKKFDLSLAIEKGKIELKAEHGREKTTSGLFQNKNLHIQVSLPENLEIDKSKARLEEGILSVLIPANKESKQVKLKIA